MLIFFVLIEIQGLEYWVFIEREYIRLEEFSFLKMIITQQEEREVGFIDIFVDGRFFKVDVLVDKFKVEVVIEVMVGVGRVNIQ